MTGAEFIRRARRYARRAGLSFRDLDGLDDTPAMSDFTLDYFFAQLLRYLEKNRDELEGHPAWRLRGDAARGRACRPRRHLLPAQTGIQRNCSIQEAAAGLQQSPGLR